MGKIVLQIAAAFMGSLAFAMMFRLRKQHLLMASFGGAAEWIVYLTAMHFMNSVFFASFTASVFTGLYAEILARRERAPVTLFFIPGIVPLIPGSTLYYTMNCTVRGDAAGAAHYSTLTLQYALAIAAGICLVGSVFSIYGNLKEKKGK